MPADVEIAAIFQKYLVFLRNYHFGIDIEDVNVYEMALKKNNDKIYGVGIM